MENKELEKPIPGELKDELLEDVSGGLHIGPMVSTSSCANSDEGASGFEGMDAPS